MYKEVKLFSVICVLLDCSPIKGRYMGRGKDYAPKSWAKTYFQPIGVEVEGAHFHLAPK